MKTKITPEVKVKAAVGVRTLNDLLPVQKTVCLRCGATAMGSILEEAKKIQLKTTFLSA
jgi:deoxyribose-phosphate aldolase